MHFVPAQKAAGSSPHPHRSWCLEASTSGMRPRLKPEREILHSHLHSSVTKPTQRPTPQAGVELQSLPPDWDLICTSALPYSRRPEHRFMYAAAWLVFSIVLAIPQAPAQLGALLASCCAYSDSSCSCPLALRLPKRFLSRSFTPLSTLQTLVRLFDTSTFQEWCLPLPSGWLDKIICRKVNLFSWIFFHQYSTRKNVNTVPVQSSSPTIHQLFLRYSFFCRSTYGTATTRRENEPKTALPSPDCRLKRSTKFDEHL